MDRETARKVTRAVVVKAVKARQAGAPNAARLTADATELVAKYGKWTGDPEAAALLGALAEA
ncbi:hypothetical protein [Streptomyces fradiae]|uniref:hypothetical protein n=1 Tax=Streptomyces fradiae TaxID=1906 RepID=UPI0036FA7D31